MLDQLKNYIREKKLLRPGERILLAVSGGIDSMVMSHLFLALEYDLSIAHCNFSLRGIESDQDEDLVRKFADKHNLPFHTKKFDTKNYAEQSGLSVQMAARELRYDWFEEIRVQNKIDYIAVAHNMNDNAETLLINLSRGTGVTGLSGIRAMRNRIIRPLLFATRQQITEYCQTNSIEYREDKSNSGTKYTRNKIRHLVIPVLKEINPSIEITLNETAERFIEIEEIVSSHIDELRTKLAQNKENEVIYNLKLLKPLSQNKTILYELFKIYGLSGCGTEDLQNIITGRTGGKIFTPGYMIVKNRNELIVTPTGIEEKQEIQINTLEDFKNTTIIKSAAVISSENFRIPTDPFVACLDAEKITFPLFLRKWKPGDNFYPLGMKKRKKLSNYLIDMKFSIPQKQRLYIIESEGEIVWVVGARIDDRYRITEKTKNILLLES